MKRLIFIGIVLCMSVTAWAQQAAPNKANEKPAETVKGLPATAVIPAAAAKEIAELQKDAELTGLRANNLQLQVEKAGVELARLREEARKAAEVLNQKLNAAAKAAGIEADKLAEYDVANITVAPDGAWILRKKDKPPASPSPGN